MLKYFRNALVSVGFIGYFPVASGTIATAVIAIIYYFFFGFLSPAGAVRLIPNLFLLLIIIVLTLIAVPIVKSAEKSLGEDSKVIVIDEVLGYLVAVLFMPHTLLVAIYAFIAFRVFDISKPPIIDDMQKLKHGWGVIADDLLAGLYANIVLQIIIAIFPRFF